MRMLIGVLLSSLLLVGCGGSDSPPPPPPGTILIVNNACCLISETYAAPSSSATWGASLGGILPTDWIAVDGLTPGLWNVMAVIDDPYSSYFAHAALDVVAGGTVEFDVVNSDFSGSLEVTNNSTYSLTALYIAPTGSGTWGLNQLSTSVGYTSTRQITDIPRGTYDVRCDYGDGYPTDLGPYAINSFSVTSIPCY